MSVILAAVDDSSVAGSVLQVAHRLADALGMTCHAIHVCRKVEDAFPEHVHIDTTEVTLRDGDPVTEIEREARDPSVTAVVLGARGTTGGAVPAGHVATAVVERARTPVVVVPPDADRTEPVGRVLIPLEGTLETSEPIAGVLTQLIDAGIDLLALHVFDVDTVPRFWDDVAHTGASFASEFESRWWHASVGPVDVLLMRGEPATTVVEVAQREQVDLIVLGWAQNLGPGRARVVRAALSEARIPVLLVPANVEPLESGRGADG